ncbi:MAG: phage protease [Terriglobia bacterium]
MDKHHDFKTVDGIGLRKVDFAYAPGDNPADWKLPIDAKHIGAALRLFPQAGLPADAKRDAALRIAHAAADHGVKEEEIERFKRQHLSERGLPVLLSGLGSAAETPSGAALHRPGAQLRTLWVAVTGSWVKDRPFSITAVDLRDMVANFAKRKNDMVVIDYEHASETPEVAMGGPVPAAGWIHNLRTDSNGQESLIALVEWTPEAEQMIHSGEYRFFSPAIDWGAADKDTGKPQGATLSSGALTNHPFLEELPPIMLSGGKIVTAGGARHRGGAGSEPPHYEGVKQMKKLSLKPIPEGDEHSGSHAVYEAEQQDPLGFIPHPELAEYAAKHLGVNPDVEEDSEESLPEEDGSDERALKVEARAAHRTAFFLREAVRRGQIDPRRASELAEAGRITLAEYIHAQEAQKLIESAVASGKILPRDQSFFFRDAMERPKEFEEYVRNAAPAVRLGTRGIGSAESLPVDEEVHLGVKRLMEDKGLNYAKALREFLSANPSLGEQYRQKHTNPAPRETTGQSLI